MVLHWACDPFRENEIFCLESYWEAGSAGQLLMCVVLLFQILHSLPVIELYAQGSFACEFQMPLIRVDRVFVQAH